MTKKEALDKINQGYKVQNNEISEVCLYNGENGRLRSNLKSIKNSQRYWDYCPDDNWELYRESRIIYFQTNLDRRDCDASKCLVDVDKEGDIKMNWYDCLDKITNKITIDKKGLNKLNQMQKAIDHVREMLESKLNEK